MKRLAAALFLVCSPALAQGPGGGELRPPPPKPPAHGPSLSGEAAGTKAGAVPDSAAPADNRSRRAAERCGELSGALREQCLLEPPGAAAGADAVPQSRTAPPPQNPR